MATIKSYTDLSQSRKLAEILPLESADMCYRTWIPLDDIPICISYTQGIEMLKSSLDLSANKKIKSLVPSWSLSALLGVLPNENMLVKTIDSEYYCLAKDVMTKHYDNPVDTCYEMILKLHELKML